MKKGIFMSWSFLELNVEQSNKGEDEILRAIHKGRKTGVKVMKEFPISSDGGGDKISLTMAIYGKGGFYFYYTDKGHQSQHSCH